MQRNVFLLATALLAGTASAQGERSAALDPQALALACAGCHGTGGRGAGAAPKLSGMNPARFTAAMGDFRSGSRPATVMSRIARGYDDAELAAMAEFFSAAGQEPRP
ncbi:c-type cytochrome [Methylogaea oryzae]|uniref:Cytochrome c domain-containing protein n=1 Tax=Methylogaea oryzae TaxID=1295382 RepID=A0A8D4VS65_9GAMM|nr:c-type cytochrome [Methylogaea oryzae]BBL71569.1 hypothetical protein MoryE10_21750 [Methylogaea oryzae]